MKKNKFNAEPTQDKIVITRSKPEDTTKGGIIIPELAIKDENIGVVVAVGPLVGEKTPKSTAVPKAGDTVQFGEYSGIETTVDGKKYIIMREADILLIFR